MFSLTTESLSLTLNLWPVVTAGCGGAVMWVVNLFWGKRTEGGGL